jgi:hypothetical protein
LTPRDQRRVDVLARRGDQHPAGAGLEVQRGVVAGPEPTGRLDDQVDTDIGPRQGVRTALGERRDAVPADGQHIVLVSHFHTEAAERRVVLEQMREGAGVVQVVDRDHLNALVSQVALQQDTQVGALLRTPAAPR